MDSPREWPCVSIIHLLISVLGDCYDLYSTGLFIAQLPWLGIYMGYIPGAAGPVNKLLEYGRKQTIQRLARGSTTRDLFHYLVSVLLGCLVCVTQPICHRTMKTSQGKNPLRLIICSMTRTESDVCYMSKCL